MDITRNLALAASLIILIGVGIWGGPGSPGDLELLRSLVGVRLANPELLPWIVDISRLGNGVALISLTLLVSIFLWARKAPHQALFVFGTAMSGRIAVELTKLAVERPRPSLVPYPVDVMSLSFPSAHAANSMITFLAIAVGVSRKGDRRFTIPAAIAASIAIGLTRPMLGVHWPSDVVAGWAYGIGWLLAACALVSPRGETATSDYSTASTAARPE